MKFDGVVIAVPHTIIKNNFITFENNQERILEIFKNFSTIYHEKVGMEFNTRWWGTEHYEFDAIFTSKRLYKLNLAKHICKTWTRINDNSSSYKAPFLIGHILKSDTPLTIDKLKVQAKQICKFIIPKHLHKNI